MVSLFLNPLEFARKMAKARSSQMKSEVGRFRLSTCDTPDNGWETCIFWKNGPSQVVESYSGQGAAKFGHNRWVQKAKTLKTRKNRYGGESLAL